MSHLFLFIVYSNFENIFRDIYIYVYVFFPILRHTSKRVHAYVAVKLFIRVARSVKKN